MEIKAEATATLQRLMVAAQVPSFRALARRAQVSDWAIAQLRRGQGDRMRVATVAAIAAALGLSVAELLAAFGLGGTAAIAPAVEDGAVNPVNPSAIADLRAEYERLRRSVAQREERAQGVMQQAALARLETWMVQWPTVTHAVEKNPELPASRLVPLVKPVAALLEDWGVVAIAAVGAEVPYDPQCHELMGGMVQPGERVRVRYVGYRQGDRLLHRAKVSPV
jgi:hypothetical protein